MNKFDIGEAWSLALAFLREHLQMLVVVVGGGALVAALLQYFAVGGDQAAQMAAFQEAFRSGDLGQIANAGGAGAMGAAGFLFLLVGGVIQSAAEFAGLRIGFSRGQEDVGSALSYGLVAAILSILFYILLGIAAVIILVVPIMLLGGAALFASGGDAAGAAGSFGLIALLLVVAMLVFIWIAVRLSVMQPAMAAARSTNPLFGLSESWRLTRGNAFMIFVYFVLLIIAAIVIFLVAGAIVGMIGGLFGPFVSMLLTTILVGIPLTILGLAVTAGIYRSLASDIPTDVFA